MTVFDLPPNGVGPISGVPPVGPGGPIPASGAIPASIGVATPHSEFVAALGHHREVNSRTALGEAARAINAAVSEAVVGVYDRNEPETLSSYTESLSAIPILAPAHLTAKAIEWFYEVMSSIWDKLFGETEEPSKPAPEEVPQRRSSPSFDAVVSEDLNIEDLSDKEVDELFDKLLNDYQKDFDNAPQYRDFLEVEDESLLTDPIEVTFRKRLDIEADNVAENYNGPLTFEDISKNLGISENMAKAILDNLYAKGVIFIVDGAWHRVSDWS